MRFLAGLLLICAHAAPIAHAADVGYLTMRAAGEYAVPLSVWYPTTQPLAAPWHAGPYVMHATAGAPVAPGRHPLVLLSHGSGGSDLGHADLAEALARRGYVVVAPRHLGDSHDQPQGRGSDVQAIGRPWQAVAALDAVLADAHLAPAIDAARIGMAGFSAGGYTTLVLAGAVPDFSLYPKHCQAHPDDAEMCPAGARSQARITRPGWQLPREHRVRAAVAMAPTTALFDADGVRGIGIPLKLYAAADDRLLPYAWHLGRLQPALKAPVAQVPGGHFVFLAPCSAALREIAPPLCTDAPGVDRVAIHERINGEIADFFDAQLK